MLSLTLLQVQSLVGQLKSHEPGPRPKNLSLQGNRRTSSSSGDFLDLRVLFARSLEKGGRAVVQVRTHIPLQGQRAASWLICLFPCQPSLAKRTGSTLREDQTPVFRRGGLPWPLLASLSQVALRGSDFLKQVYGVSFLHFFRSQTLGSKKREGQELGTGSSAQEHRARERPWPRVPLRSGSTRDARPHPAARLPSRRRRGPHAPPSWLPL